jgi:hypothetical protein
MHIGKLASYNQGLLTLPGDPVPSPPGGQPQGEVVLYTFSSLLRTTSSLHIVVNKLKQQLLQQQPIKLIHYLPRCRAAIHTKYKMG